MPIDSILSLMMILVIVLTSRQIKKTPRDVKNSLGVNHYGLLVLPSSIIPKA